MTHSVTCYKAVTPGNGDAYGAVYCFWEWGGGSTGFQKADVSPGVWTTWRKGSKWDGGWRLLLVRKERTSNKSR